MCCGKYPSGEHRDHLCARCHRHFTPKKEEDKYGPVCARKLAGQVQLDSQALISGKVLRRKKAHGEVVYPGAVIV